MKAWRLEHGGEIDRTRPLSFSFDGHDVSGFAGDTLASALLASGVSIVGRSFKYHRPRGVWGAGAEEPNAIVDVEAASFTPNVKATTAAAIAGIKVRSVNGMPTAAADRHAFIDRLARFIPSGFYYKTFMLPDWRLFEPKIRAMAGLGRLDPTTSLPMQADQINETCDLLVVGAGPAGLAAAVAAAEAGRSVILCDSNGRTGGSLLHRSATIDALPGSTWVEHMTDCLAAAGGRILPQTTAFGCYDHGLVALAERRGEGLADRLWRIRPRHLMLATGAIERPLPFANNDLPGIMSADAALVYLARFGVVVGRRIVVATNNGQAYETANALAKAGADVTVVDYRAVGDRFHFGEVFTDRRIEGARGRRELHSVLLDDGTVLAADALLVSGGFSPTVQLYSQARGRLAWDEKILSFVPGKPVDGVSVIGAAAGEFDLQDVLDGSLRALAAIGIETGRSSNAEGLQPAYRIAPAWPRPGMKGRVWIDLQNDVTAKDVELAQRENFVSVEHLKRYTTLGMATDQGKTSNLPGLALMAELTGKRIPEVGTTTSRPPFTSVPFATLGGLRGGVLMNPVRRLPLEARHRADGAFMRDYGGWLRPAWYGEGDADQRIREEAWKARESVALFDGSPLGKIEVIGPQAAEFMDFMYYNRMSNLKVGRCRYGFILSESGVVLDDGVLVRLDENRFVISCSSSHVAAVYGLLEEWRQDRFDRRRLFIHNATAQYATLTVSGPNARALLDAAGIEALLDDAALPHMASTHGAFRDTELRITRVSFTGDRSYELSLPADQAEALWAQLREAGKPFNATLLGVEALMILRAEKGYLVIGKDTDGETRPMDLDVTAPLLKKTVEFLGRRSLLSEEASRGGRRQFVGLESCDDGVVLPTGAHTIELSAGRPRSIGYVTSSYFSPVLARPIALGLVEGGLSRLGDTVDIQHLGRRRQARIAAPCAFDPNGERLNA